MGYEHDVADLKAVIEDTARRRARHSADWAEAAKQHQGVQTMGAMNRPTPDELAERVIDDAFADRVGWRLLMFVREFQWGVFVVDDNGTERLEAAAKDQETAIKIAPALAEEARHVRIRRLR